MKTAVMLTCLVGNLSPCFLFHPFFLCYVLYEYHCQRLVVVRGGLLGGGKLWCVGFSLCRVVNSYHLIWKLMGSLPRPGECGHLPELEHCWDFPFGFRSGS